jgi:hypothetical protein
VAVVERVGLRATPQADRLAEVQIKIHRQDTPDTEHLVDEVHGKMAVMAIGLEAEAEQVELENLLMTCPVLLTIVMVTEV